MKCNISFFKMKVFLISMIFLTTSTFCDVKPPKANPYKEDKSIHHSLYREKNNPERVSVFTQAIPTPKKE
jgi:hypothetical protein